MNQGKHGVDGQLPTRETKPDINQDSANHPQHGQQALRSEFITHLRTDKLDFLQLYFMLAASENFQNIVTDLRTAGALARSQSDHDIRGRAEMLNQSVRKIRCMQGIANFRQISRLGVSYLDQSAP